MTEGFPNNPRFMQAQAGKEKDLSQLVRATQSPFSVMIITHTICSQNALLIYMLMLLLD